MRVDKLCGAYNLVAYKLCQGLSRCGVVTWTVNNVLGTARFKRPKRRF